MKKAYILLAALFAGQALQAQLKPNDHQASFELGEGLNFNFQDGDYRFKIGGFIQPNIEWQQVDTEDGNFLLNSKRTYFNISGQAKEEKLSFLLQLDFSRTNPLLDVWVAYHPWQALTITMGQKQNIGNNREMLIMENNLQFADRSLFSESFSRSGRELGLFLDLKLGTENFRVIPQASLTSGDGINSFGADSRDVDLGGFKYSGRIDLLPLGDFSEGGLEGLADLNHEEDLKMIIGLAGSYNDGASDAVGEGHGTLVLYDGAGAVQYPDYRQWFADLLMKYRGLSLYAEYGQGSATNLEGSYLNPSIEDPLLATQISEYYNLGTGFNGQLGYVSKGGYGIDLRYSAVYNEFENNQNALLGNSNAYGLALSRYLKGNDLKVLAAVNYREYPEATQLNFLTAQLMVQVVF